MRTNLTAFEWWMVRSNVARAKHDGIDPVPTLRANGYYNVAAAVEAALTKAVPA